MRYISIFIYSNHPGVRIFRHVVFWVSDIINYLVVISLVREVNATEVSLMLLKLIFVILVTYFILYYLIPKFSKQSNDVELFLWIIGVLAFLGVGIRYYKFYIIFPLVDPAQKIGFDILDFRRVLNEIINSVMVISQAIAIKVIKNRSELQQENKQLLQEKRKAELSFLKAQMHPHFLFNTLNTLYSETLQDSGKAEQVVLHLSNLLRFILDECNKPMIAFSKEIKVIHDYIELEKLRHGSRLHINLTVPTVDPDLLISPLIFLPFIENSFKHSLNNLRGPININVEVGLVHDMIRLKVDNDNNKKAHRNGFAIGKGTTNVRRQLELLYGKEYDLNIDDAENKYSVSLLIPIKSRQNHE